MSSYSEAVALHDSLPPTGAVAGQLVPAVNALLAADEGTEPRQHQRGRVSTDRGEHVRLRGHRLRRPADHDGRRCRRLEAGDRSRMNNENLKWFLALAIQILVLIRNFVTLKATWQVRPAF